MTSYRLHCVGKAGCCLVVEVLIESLRDVKDGGARWARNLHLHLHASHAWVLHCSYSSCRGSMHPDKLLQLWGGSHTSSWLLLLLNNLHLSLLLSLTLLLLLLLHLLL